MVKVPLEQDQGGNLPSQSIQIKPTTTATPPEPEAPVENWIATAPFFSEWVNSGVPSGCTNWSPDPSTKSIGESFTQTATNCEQQQIRTRQEQEQETTTLAVRNSGDAVTETQTITVSSTRTAVGTNPSECRYLIDGDNYSYGYRNKQDSQYHYIWNGTTIGYGSKTLQRRGFIYTISTYMNDGGFNDTLEMHEICREPT